MAECARYAQREQELQCRADHAGIIPESCRGDHRCFPPVRTEDVFSDIFIKYNSEGEYNGDIKGFVAFIAKRRAVDTLRRLTSRGVNAVSIDDNEALQLSSAERVDELAEKAETGHAILDAVRSLGEPDSTIIMQKYYYGRNSADIADIVGMKPAAVRKRLSRAAEKLKKILTDMGEGR